MKIVIHTLGCKVNQYESDSLALSLKKEGHEVLTSLVPADIYILNTCAVTAQSEQKSRQLVAKVNKLNPKASIIVMGCASQNNPEQFISKPNVSIVLGTASKYLVPQILEQIGNFTKVLPKEYEDSYKIAPLRARATLKIQDGCDNYCAFCLIPYLRGTSRSRPLHSIIEEANMLAKASKEIVITGINTSDYKIKGQLSLSTIMQTLKDLPARIRISSLEVGIITEEFLQILKDMPNFCPHFHLSLQSGSNQVLKDMNRHYTKEEYLSKVRLIRKYFKNPAITTDIIVGYSTETSKLFKETLKTLKKAKFFDMHIFPYSKRAGTKAYDLKELDKQTIKERAKRVRKLKNKGFKKYINKNLKKSKTILIESIEQDFLVGHSQDFIKVYLPKNSDILRGNLVIVKLQKAYKDGAIAKILN